MKPEMQSFDAVVDMAKTDWTAAAVAMNAVDMTAKPDAVAVIVRSKVSDGEVALALTFPTPQSLTDMLTSLMMMGDKVWAPGGKVRSPEEIARGLNEARVRARELTAARPVAPRRRPTLKRVRPK